MSNHFLTRNADNEPVCGCDFRPDLLDEPVPGPQWKAKTQVLEHVKALGGFLTKDEAKDLSDAEFEAKIRAIYATPTPAPPRSPEDPFNVRDAKYPRAGVRQTDSGKWMLCLWNGPQILHVFDEPVFDDRQVAFDYGWLTIGACRDSGTNLNGWAA